MATDLEIANQALTRVGAETITSGEWASPTHERARVVVNSWPFVRKAVLREHSWNSVTTRATLKSRDAAIPAFVPDWDFTAVFPLPVNCLRVLEVSGTEQWRIENAPVSQALLGSYTSTYPLASGGSVLVAMGTAHGLSDGDRVYLTAANQASLVNDIQIATTTGVSTNFILSHVDTDGFANGSAAGGTAYKVTFGPCLVTDGTGLGYIRYIEDKTDPSTFDAMLTEALVLRLAVEIVERVTDSTRKREALMVEYQDYMREVKHIEGEEQSPSDFEEDLWITARY